jgi:hypothetical protein
MIITLLVCGIQYTKNITKNKHAIIHYMQKLRHTQHTHIFNNSRDGFLYYRIVELKYIAIVLYTIY